MIKLTKIFLSTFCFSLFAACFTLSANILTNSGYVKAFPSNLNITQIQQSRLDRHNQERKKIGLSAYTGDTKLHQTAQMRASIISIVNKATHKRKATDNYYDFNSIKDRFSSQGVTFKNKSGYYFSENLAYQYYKCSKADCTEDFLKQLKKCFDFFMSEKKANGAHYKAIVNKQFEIIGMGLGFIGNKFFVVTHYGTKLKP